MKKYYLLLALCISFSAHGMNKRKNPELPFTDFEYACKELIECLDKTKDFVQLYYSNQLDGEQQKKLFTDIQNIEKNFQDCIDMTRNPEMIESFKSYKEWTNTLKSLAEKKQKKNA